MIQPLKVNELAEKIMKGEQVYLLDVRSEEAFQDWAIDGKQVTIKNIPYQQVKENPQAIKKQLPIDQPVYVVCPRGVSSRYAMQYLQEAGAEAVTHLEDGMIAWSEHLTPVKIADLYGDGALYQFVRIGKGCLSYVIVSNGEAAIVDPVRFTDQFRDFIRSKGWTVKAVIDTHLHADHISGGRELAEEMNAPYFFPPKDDERVTFDYKALQDGQTIAIGKTTLKAFYTPGHTIGSTSLIVDDQYLHTGDILFIESIGRPDLAGMAEKWVRDLRETLYTRFENLANDLVVLPAHFSSMNEINNDGSIHKRLDEIYQDNPQLQVKDRHEFAHMITSHLPPQPNSHNEIRKINLGVHNPDENEKREMEVGPNRCAVS